MKLLWVMSLHSDTFTPNLPFLLTKFACCKSNINPVMHLLDKAACVYSSLGVKDAVLVLHLVGLCIFTGFTGAAMLYPR